MSVNASWLPRVTSTSSGPTANPRAPASIEASAPRSAWCPSGSPYASTLALSRASTRRYARPIARAGTRRTSGAPLLKFSVQTPDLGEAQDEMPIKYAGDQLDIGFNGAYLLEILKFMPTEEVKLTFKAPERAATIEPEGWGNAATYLCLLMPLRLVD